MTSAQYLRQKVITQLSQIYDPELPINIVDLGIIYGIDISENKILTLTMTLTTPNCPAAKTFPNAIRSKIEQIPELQGVDIELVWEPSWQRSMMDPNARAELGI